MRHFNISQIARMFDLSRDTVRKRLRAAGIAPSGKEANAPIYDMAKVGPALFGGSIYE